MTISPIVGAMMQPSFSDPAPARTSPVADVTTPATVFPDPVAVPGPHGTPVTAPSETAPARAELVSGDTPGDDIIAGLNKRWGRFSRAMAPPDGSSSRLDADGSGPPARTSGSDAWSAVDDGDYDAHAERMGSGIDTADVTAELGRIRDVDRGGALMLELSKGVQGVESSIKTLVTGQ